MSNGNQENIEDSQRPVATSSQNSEPQKAIPKGVVLGADGKPCRSCTSFASWAANTKKVVATSPSSTSTTQSWRPPTDCPPDVEELGSSSWTLLHSIAAQFPVRPTIDDQTNARMFIKSFSKLYPCWTCASDFQEWLRKDENAPRVSSRSDFGQWMCEAHNEVNHKLGKKTFDCSRWEERWRTGWKDGRCD